MSNRAIRKRVRKLEERIIPKPKEDLILVWSSGPKDEPHGKYGYRKYHILTGEVEACTEDEEIELLREAYYRIPPKVKKRVNYWSSFEKFKEQHICNCEQVDNDARAHDEENKHLQELDKMAFEAAVKNFIDSIKRDIYTLIRTGEIENNESVQKILSLFDYDE